MNDFAVMSPIIVCGCQRSGTTAIVRILNDHGLMISNEWSLFAWPSWKEDWPLAAWLENKKLSVESDIWLQHWDYKITLRGDEAEQGFQKALHSIYDSRPAFKWGDKWSDYVFHVDEIKVHFPKAKIIYIYRDGRDCVASMLRKGMVKNAEQGFKQWVNSIRAWLAWRDKIDHVAIQQEVLLRDPETVARSIAAYCSFPFQSSKHAAHVLFGADHESTEDHQSENRYKHTGAYRDQFSDDDIPVDAMQLLIILGYVNEECSAQGESILDISPTERLQL